MFNQDIYDNYHNKCDDNFFVIFVILNFYEFNQFAYASSINFFPFPSMFDNEFDNNYNENKFNIIQST
jgi:hypothetical protein